MVFAACFFSAFAQSNDSVVVGSSTDSIHSEKSIIELDRIVVTASKRSMPADMVVENVKVVTAKDAKASGAFNAMELLDAIPGMDIDPARTQTNLILNGMSGSYVKILKDGIPVTGDVGGGFPLENLVLGDVDRIEVMSGASSTMYGTDAIGGVVNFISERPGTMTPLRLRASYNYLNNDSIAAWGGKNRLDLSAAHVNQLLSAQGFYSFDFDEGTYNYNLDGGKPRIAYAYPESRRQAFGFKCAVYPSDQLKITPQAAHTTSRTQRNKADGDLAILENTYRTLNLSASFNATPQFSLQGYAQAADFEHLNRTVKQGAVTSTLDSRTRFVTYDTELRLHGQDLIRLGGKDNALVGFNVIHESIDSDNLRKGASRIQAAPFLGAYWESGTPVNVVVNPSLRVAVSYVSDVKKDTTLLSDICPKIGVRINDIGVEGTYASLSYGHAYQVPRFKNMYYRFNMGNMMWIEGNEDLSPEKSNQFNAGYGYRWDRFLEGSVSGFYNRINDVIVLRSVLHDDGSAVMRGMDGEAESELQPGEGIPEKTYINALWGYKYGVSSEFKIRPLPWMEYSLAATRILSFAENDEGAMLEEEHYSRNSVHFSARLHIENLRKYLPNTTITAIWKDKQIDTYDDAGNAVYLDSYTKLNIQLSKSVLNGLSVRLSANNILDYQRPGHAGLDYGRTYTAAIDMNIDNIAKIGESFKQILF